MIPLQCAVDWGTNEWFLCKAQWIGEQTTWFLSDAHMRAIKHLYYKATIAVLFSDSTGKWFRTTAGVRQGCLLSPTLFNLFLERIVTDALEDHEGTVSFGGRTITKLRFVDDIDGLAGEEEELAKLVERLDKASTVYGMESCAE